MTDMIDLQQETRGGIVIIRLQGRLDAITSPPAFDALTKSIEEGNRQLLLNFSGVDYLSSAGMRILMALHKRLKTAQGKLIISAVNPPVMDILKMSGFNQLLQIATTDEEAIAQF